MVCAKHIHAPTFSGGGEFFVFDILFSAPHSAVSIFFGTYLVFFALFLCMISFSTLRLCSNLF